MKWCLFVLTFACVFSASAKTLIIADVDDTLKNSHVLNSTDKYAKALYTNDLFLGMNWLTQGLATEHPDFKFFYVSNAISDLMLDFHRDFLVGNKFASGEIDLCPSFFCEGFKKAKIREILKAEKPDVVINLGDNGQMDSQILEQLRLEFPQIQFTTYIHQVYSSKNVEEKGTVLAPGQIGFVTSLDLLLNLHSQNLISDNFAQKFLVSFSDSYAAKKRGDINRPFPDWVNCQDFTWSVNDSVFANLAPFNLVKSQILQRCSGPALGDD